LYITRKTAAKTARDAKMARDTKMARDAKMAFWRPLGVAAFLLLLYFRPFLRLKSGLPVGLAQAAGLANPTVNPNFNTQKEVLVMRVVLTVGDERTEFTTG
jgi:hypothetical protein